MSNLEIQNAPSNLVCSFCELFSLKVRTARRIFYSIAHLVILSCILKDCSIGEIWVRFAEKCMM